MYQQLWGYKVEEKLYLGVREQKRLNTTDRDLSDDGSDSPSYCHGSAVRLNPTELLRYALVEYSRLQLTLD
jgi:hypothetical protein